MYVLTVLLPASLIYVGLICEVVNNVVGKCDTNRKTHKIDYRVHEGVEYGKIVE